MKIHVLILTFVLVLGISMAEQQIYPFGYGGGDLKIGSSGWNDLSDYFDFWCSGPGDMQGTECYGQNPDGTGSFSSSGAYSLVEFYYECEPYNYEGGCSYGNGCGMYYDDNVDVITDVYVQGDAASVVKTKTDYYFNAQLIKGAISGTYSCTPCGHGKWVYYVRPTKCYTHLYTKSFSSCNALCEEAFSHSEGREENGECKCFCKDGFKAKVYEDDTWDCEMDIESYEEAEEFMSKMKDKFPGFIEKYELLLIKEEIKGELDLTKFI